VTLRHDRDRPYLAAHIVPAGPEPPGEPELRRFLADRLPRYMIPATFVPMNRLPLTRNGKLDTAALPDPIERDEAAPPTPPRTETERALAGLWGELLGVGAIDIHANFFDMGGDSLLITQFHARVVEAFGIDLPMRRVYGALDIASLAETVDQIRSEAYAGRLERLVTEIEQMPEEELRRRLG
jgi:nonribosomal peptide synthetase protein BlmVII